MSQKTTNLKIFSSGGVLGRYDYFITYLKIIGLFCLAAIPAIIGLAVSNKFPIITIFGIGVSCLAGIPLTYAAWINSFKRIRDIRGTQDSENMYFSGYVIMSIIPYLNIVTVAIFFVPSSERTENIINFPNSSAHKKNEIENLEKLHYLKQNGAISDAEYEQAKKRAMDKIAS